MNNRYFKEDSYYNNLYDLYTIKDSLKTYWNLRDRMMKRRSEVKDLSDEKFEQDLNKTLNYFLYFQKGERYRNKKKTIDEWMTKDKVQQDKFDNALEPQNVFCTKCNVLMHGTFKELENYTDEPVRIFFFFECPKCKKRKGIYENGEEKISKPPTCSKCGKIARMTYKKKGKVITWTTKCSSCGYKEVNVDDFDKNHAEFEKERAKDKELLEKYRKDFCFTNEQGQEFIEYIEKLEVAKQVKEETMQKYQSPIYQKIIHLKKLGIVELEKLLAENLEKEKYVKLTLDKPQIGQFVIVSITVMDANPSQQNYLRINSLQKLIKDLLENTNWRLVSNSLSYRLGYISGQLKGYERDEDIMKLEYPDEKKQPLSKIDEEKRMKYAHDPLVRLAKMEGEFEVIENIRKERLKKSPEGFFLDVNEGPYTCAICGETTPGNNIWWNLEGLRCADCWRNIKEKVIPPLDYDIDNKMWIKNWQIQSDYNVHPMTARKLRRLDELIGRDLKRKDGSIYCTVYLVSENKKFIKKYPKKEKIKVTYQYSKNK